MMIMRTSAFFFFFFFSSRRRHTRFDCDWSSDVCSSDLKGFDPALANAISEDDIEHRQRHDYRLTADHHMEVRIPVMAGARLVSVGFTHLAAVIPGRGAVAASSPQKRLPLGDAGGPGGDSFGNFGPASARG